MALNLCATFNRELDGVITLNWENSDNRDLELKDFCRIRLPKYSFVRQENTLISGRAPLWVYMYSALKLKSRNAETISVFQPQKGRTRIFPIVASSCSETISGPDVTHREGFCFLQYPSEVFTPEQLPAFQESVPECDDSEAVIIFSGRLCNWVAAFLALVAQEKGWKRIAYFSPKNGRTLQIYPRLKWLNIGTPLSRNGKVIGIVGDPNSGKSVFSNALYQSGLFAGEKIWFYDCDYSAPTPPWYLATLKSKSRELADNLRRAIKKSWEPGAETQVASNIKKVQRHLDWLIADLPGGNFALMPPQRIPQGREILMNAIDYFVVLARKDLESDKYWQEALSKHGLDNRIILTVYSEHPDRPPFLHRDEEGSWHISGMRRENSDSFSDALKTDLWNLISNAILSVGENGE